MAKKNINEMSFLDHLEDLRWHLIRIVSAVVIVATLAFIFSRFVFEKIIFAPLDMSFPTYSFLCKAGNFVGVDTTFCADKIPMIIQSRTMAGQFSADIWTAIHSLMLFINYGSLLVQVYIVMNVNILVVLLLFLLYYSS